MAKRYVYEDSYRTRTRKTHPKGNKPFLIEEKYTKRENRDKITELLTIAKKYIEIIEPYLRKAIKSFESISSWLSRNYLPFTLTLVVIGFSLLLPNISQKLHKNSELKAINNVLHRMQDEVKRAEVECLAANEKICDLHCTLCDETIETITSAGDFPQHNLILDQRRKGLDSLAGSSLSISRNSSKK
ncbi:uncharacterized protein LOC123871596 isoform X2 [Maniola jurtina]|uniref:uncharacterized protein LOC123871596 isoform X2 n=1 Tax=Maniola jurtina TaxID=191418 RepID=UPI001E6898A5|nr:uncharacterized protein LOC123871596 isoform X2 [Maniola jurtina]